MYVYVPFISIMTQIDHIRLSLFDVDAQEKHSYALHYFQPTDFNDDFVATVYMKAFCMKSMPGNDNHGLLFSVAFVNAKVLQKFKRSQNLTKLLM